MSRDLPASASVRATFAASTDVLGLGPPPCKLRLKILEGHVATSLFLLPDVPVPLGRIVDWLEPLSPRRIEFGTRGVFRADIDSMPLTWSDMFRGIDLEMLTLDPGAPTTCTIRGGRARVSDFSRRLRDHHTPMDVRSLGDAMRHAPLLTGPQDAALRAAVTSGYYLIPRPLNLRDLAAKLHVTSASLSERLRRAEARVLSQYVLAGGASPWDEERLFAAPAAGES